MDTNLNQNTQQVQTNNGGVVTLGDWLLTILLSLIPIVNIVMLFVWSFSGSTPKSKSNWAKATLIFVAIGIVLNILFGAAILSALSSLA
ncbi:MAG: hypothetical protein ACERKV_11845 [Clostridiaceae bacterium]